MEMKRCGGQSNFREEALQGALYELQKNILENNNKCQKVFKIFEKESFDEIYGKNMFRFKIEEISINNVILNVPKVNYINTNKKYSFKERLRILFKGE